MAGVMSMDLTPRGPRESSDFMGAPVYSHSRGVSLASSRERLPIPEFSFPARPAEPESSDPTATFAMPPPPNTTSSTRQKGNGSRRSASALPNFSFNPATTMSSGASTPVSEEMPATPPLSPVPAPPITPSRHFGHRRGGSEFIGGDGKTGGNGLMSTSPTKGNDMMAGPAPSMRLGPPAGRRGHAHRRSGAISCHDLQSILQPTDGNSRTVGGSAPVTPLEIENKTYFPLHSRRTGSQASAKVSSEPSSPPNEYSDSSPQKTFPRPRVGFSDQLEFIRPLSTISSETESSMSTIRGGHSVNGSLSSVLSGGAPSPSSVRTGRPSLQTTFEEENLASRPRTASDVLDSTSPGKLEFGENLFLPERPRSAASTESPTVTSPSTASPVKGKSTSKKRGFGWFEQRRSSRGNCHEQSGSIPASKSEPSLLVTPPDTPAVTDSEMSHELDDSSFSALAIDQDKKPRKARSWAHSLMSLRHRQKATTDDADDELSTGPSSAVSTPAEEVDFRELVADFDADNTVDIVTAPQMQPQPNQFLAPSPASFNTAATSLTPDALSPIIDLDAALGPFNTPPLGARSPLNRGVQRKSMHSSGGSGSGTFNITQQHRRTESAPALVPFETRSAKMSNSTMADVFEEEEEDDYNSPRRSRKNTATADSPIPEEANDDSGLGIQIVDSAEDKIDESTTNATFEAFSLNRPSLAQSPPQSPLTRSPELQTAAIIRSSREVSPVEVVEDFEEPRASSMTKDSDSTVTPNVTDDEAKQLCPPLQLTMPIVPPPIMTPDTLSASPMSTPDYRRGSRPSFELPRVGTAASSFTDTRTMSSFALGEPGPDYRCSVDDVPSLTSSHSANTNTLHHPLSQAQTYADARSVSVGSRPSAGTERARKRGSIASLSRLITGDSFTSRSKLSIVESRPQSEPRDEDSKSRKKNRMSRLMAFWKSKERLNS